MLYICTRIEKESKATIAIKLYLIMKLNVNTIKQQTQDYLLRLFVESSIETTPSDSYYYTCSRCGTFSKCH